MKKNSALHSYKTYEHILDRMKKDDITNQLRKNKKNPDGKENRTLIPCYNLHHNHNKSCNLSHGCKMLFFPNFPNCSFDKIIYKL